MTRTVTALIAIVFCLPAHAAEQWLRIRSTNFEMLTDAGEKKGSEAILYFEGVRKFFADSGIVRNVPAVDVRILAFRSEKEFKPYAPNEVAAAYYQPGLEHDYIVMSSIAEESYPAAIHEYFHLLVQHSGIKLPLWLNEGLADFYSSLQPRGKKLVVGAPLPGRLQILRENRLAPLEIITTVDERSPFYNEKNRANIFYAESWALAHMLVVGNGYRPNVARFLDAMARGTTAANAFETVYGKTLPEVQKDLLSYISGTSFNGYIFNLQLDKKSEEPDVEPMASWDARFALADFMASGRAKEADARRLLQQLAAEDPKRWEPEAALATLDMRSMQTNSALAHFKRAAELGATDPRMYFRYAMTLRGSDKTQSIAMLRKALELKPDYEDAHFWLGFVYMDAGEYVNALAQFDQVKHLKPEQAFPFFQSVAYADYRIDRRDQAKAVIARARQYAKDFPQQHALDELARALDEPATPPQQTVNVISRAHPQRQVAQQMDAGPALATASGTFVELACEGETARMGVSSNGAVTWFLMDDPHAITIDSSSGPTMDLACGKQQKPHRVTIRYVPHAGGDNKTAGLVRAIHFE